MLKREHKRGGYFLCIVQVLRPLSFLLTPVMHSCKMYKSPFYSLRPIWPSVQGVLQLNEAVCILKI